jgi:hypothetical protein
MALPTSVFHYLRSEHGTLLADYFALLAEHYEVQRDAQKRPSHIAKVQSYRLLLANHRLALRWVLATNPESDDALLTWSNMDLWKRDVP